MVTLKKTSLASNLHAGINSVSDVIHHVSIDLPAGRRLANLARLTQISLIDNSLAVRSDVAAISRINLIAWSVVIWPLLRSTAATMTTSLSRCITVADMGIRAVHGIAIPIDPWRIPICFLLGYRIAGDGRQGTNRPGKPRKVVASFALICRGWPIWGSHVLLPPSAGMVRVVCERVACGLVGDLVAWIAARKMWSSTQRAVVGRRRG
jgi:hypothetical protein